MNFDDVLFPLDKNEFLCDYIGKKPYINKGNSDKFSFLLDWNDVNRIVQEHRLEHPRMRMFKDITLVPETNYVIKNPSRRGSINPIVSVREFNNEILNGATLIVDAIQEVHKPIRELCEEFNSDLKGVCQVNCYIALADQQAFDTHWDGHEVFVLQVTGKKYWKVYFPTRIHPLDTDIYQSDQSKEKQIFWEGVLEQGDMLYIPKGWWHTVSPIGTETVHLTFGYVAPTGIDFLKWAIEQMYTEEFVRAPSPLFLKDTIQKAYAENLSELILKHLTGDGFRKHMEDRIGKLHPRIAPALPFSADPRERELPKTLQIKATSKNVLVKADTKSFFILAFNKKYEFDLKYLFMTQEILMEKSSVAEILEKKYHDDDTVMKFIVQLMRLGLLQIC